MLPLRRGDGLRHPLPAADPSDRESLSQGAQQHAQRRANRSQPWAIGDESGGHKSVHAALGTPRRLRCIRAPGARLGMERRSTSPFRHRPTIPRQEHPSGFEDGPTDRFSTREPPKKYHRISAFDFEFSWLRSGNELLSVFESGSSTAFASSASTTRTQVSAVLGV